MKKIVLSLALVGASFAFAQKKEIQNASKAIEKNDIAAAKAEISKAEGLLNDQLYLLEPSVLEEYYYAKGVLLIKEGKTREGAALLGKITDLKTIYTGKNSDKKKVFFAGKEAAEKSGIQGLKVENYTPKTTEKVNSFVNPLLKSASDEAYKAYQAKNYNKAAEKYEEVYNLLKAVGNEDKTYLYYAGINYQAAGKNNEAIEIYNSLISSGYTGVTTQYLATDVKTGQVQSFDKNSFELIKKSGSNEYKDLKTQSTPSVELELYEANIRLLVDAARYDEALVLIEKGLKKFPNNQRLSELQGIAYYRSGKTAEFIQNLKNQVAKNPNDKESWYNLGFLQSQDNATLADAEKSFKKALEIDGNYVLALQGLAYAVHLKDDEKTLEQIRAFQKAKKINEMNKLMEKRRETFKKALPYLEKWHSIEPKNVEVVSTLKGIYMNLDNMDKYNHFKKLEDSLKK